MRESICIRAFTLKKSIPEPSRSKMVSPTSTVGFLGDPRNADRSPRDLSAATPNSPAVLRRILHRQQLRHSGVSGLRGSKDFSSMADCAVTSLGLRQQKQPQHRPKKWPCHDRSGRAREFMAITSPTGSGSASSTPKDPSKFRLTLYYWSVAVDAATALSGFDLSGNHLQSNAQSDRRLRQSLHQSKLQYVFPRWSCGERFEPRYRDSGSGRW